MSEEVKFEKAMERLSKIVEELEAGEVSLDEALKKYEEGVKLSRTCQDQLSRAEKKIEILTKTLDGTAVKKPFHYEDSSGGEEGSKKPKPGARKAPESPSDEDEEKDLLF